MDLIFITNEVTRASIAQSAGVDFIMVDLEINGKVARQGHRNTLISRHSVEDVGRIRGVLNRSRLLVRVNPLFAGSEAEIDECIHLGADAVMLPMFTSASEVRTFVQLVGGRAKTWLLLETPQAMVRAHDIASCDGVDVIHIGLNDLHLGMGLTFMFELLAYGVVDWLAEQLHVNAIHFGFGGVARLHTGMLDAGLILSEHVRLRSSQVILSRDFQGLLIQDDPASEGRFGAEIAALRDEVTRLSACSTEDLARNRHELRRKVGTIVAASHAGSQQ